MLGQDTLMSRALSLLLGGWILFTLPVEAQTYYVYANAESEDEVALIRFDGETAEVAKTIKVGAWPLEIEGPHGITVDPSGAFWYLTMAHGMPFGTLYKYRTGTDELVGKVELGLYPATMQVSPATGFLYVVNFNLHGDMVPSTVSIVETETMTEIAQVETGVMPHGSRMSPDGERHYSVAMMSDMLYEMDTWSFEIIRTLNVNPMAGHAAHAGMDHMSNLAKPTWVIPHPYKPLAYVANNGIAEIAEVSLGNWEVTRRFKTEKGPYNLDVTPDGKRLLITHKGAASIGVMDIKTGEYEAIIPTSRAVTHGILTTPDGRYAFATAEGVGAEAGVVDVFDLNTLKHVATAEMGKQAGGLAFWKMEE